MTTQTREDWLAERRTGIGGSDVAAILGLNEYESPYSVWADKLGLLPPKDENEAMRQGRDLEGYVAQRFCEATGKRVRRVNRSLVHLEHTFMRANIDRDVVGENAGLECKTTSLMNLKQYKSGEYPARYYCQCMHYMAVTGKAKWYLAVLVLNQGFYLFDIPRDDEEIAALVEAERDFWKLVVDKTPPPIDGSDATRRALDIVHPELDGEPPAALFGVETLIEERSRIKAEISQLTRRVKEIDNGLVSELSGRDAGVAHGYEITYRTIRKAPHTVKAQEYRQLRIREVSDE